MQAAHAEPDAPPQTAEALAAELRRMAGWLGLDDVAVAAAATSGRRSPTPCAAFEQTHRNLALLDLPRAGRRRYPIR